MLVLRRKKNQSLVINGDITISVLDIGNDWIKLAIDAPREVKILRSELLEAAQANQEAAGDITTESVKALRKFLKPM